MKSILTAIGVLVGGVLLYCGFKTVTSKPGTGDGTGATDSASAGHSASTGTDVPVSNPANDSGAYEASLYNQANQLINAYGLRQITFGVLRGSLYNLQVLAANWRNRTGVALQFENWVADYLNKIH